MKITKNATIKASSTDTEELNDLVLQDASNYVQSAIDSLAAVIRRNSSDEIKAIANDCIADLSVVLLTLKG